ncbi:hypothetical protein BDY21DRAFT_353718 [Lineolata rhizophorae]|uniref:Uncharacterized protein n=1 Tax=Lineolata rhizophorae TaxID=578093 RepID=A0A6A6NSW5_9PEZI|nr:hypothetical protein BDY21DRAFT_353718 [Lineolata rhizophorae]
MHITDTPDSIWWFWYAGEVLFGAMLMLKMIPATTAFLKWVGESIRHRVEDLLRSCGDRYEDLMDAMETEKPHRILLEASILFFFLIAGAMVWGLLTFLAFWSYGKIFPYPVQFLAHLVVFSWATFDILHIRTHNEDLVTGSELKMGFGQVLAIVMMAMVPFNVMDAFAAVKREMKESK